MMRATRDKAIAPGGARFQSRHIGRLKTGAATGDRMWQECERRPLERCCAIFRADIGVGRARV